MAVASPERPGPRSCLRLQNLASVQGLDVCKIGALIFTNTILGAPYYRYRYNGPRNLVLIMKAPRSAVFVRCCVLGSKEALEESVSLASSEPF